MRFRKTLYGWLLKPGQYCLGWKPPDSPAMPYTLFPSMMTAEAAATGRKANIIWCGAALAEKERISQSRTGEL
jgi:hypothetical protein